MPNCEADQDRSRRPVNGRAGEVTRKKKADSTAQDDSEEKPPAFSGPKIGGAKEIVRKDVTTAQSGAQPGQKDLFSIGGIRINDFSLNGTSKGLGVYKSAPPGKTRFWATVSDVQKEAWSVFPSVWVSTTCKACSDGNMKCSGWETEDWPMAPDPAPCRPWGSGVPNAFVDRTSSGQGFPTNWWSRDRFRGVSFTSEPLLAQRVRFAERFLPIVPDFPTSKLRCEACINARRPCLRMVEYESGTDSLPRPSARPLSEFEWLRQYLDEWAFRTRGTALAILPQSSCEEPEPEVNPTTSLSQDGSTTPIKQQKPPRATYSQIRATHEELVQYRSDVRNGSKEVERSKDEWASEGQSLAIGVPGLGHIRDPFSPRFKAMEQKSFWWERSNVPHTARNVPDYIFEGLPSKESRSYEAHAIQSIEDGMSRPRNRRRRRRDQHNAQLQGHPASGNAGQDQRDDT